jgi:hypothetical protein
MCRIAAAFSICSFNGSLKRIASGTVKSFAYVFLCWSILISSSGVFIVGRNQEILGRHQVLDIFFASEDQTVVQQQDMILMFHYASMQQV